MTTILGISGSLRRQSFNTSLLRTAASLVSDGTRIVIHSIADIPLYNNDVETGEGIPASVHRLKDALIASDGLLICSPEYNNSIPGVVKNAIDWASRPPDDIRKVFGGLPVAVAGASAGRFGTVLAQNAWLPVLRTLGTNFWSGGRMMVPVAGKVFDDEGHLVDEAIRERLQTFVEGFVKFAGEHSRHSN